MGFLSTASTAWMLRLFWTSRHGLPGTSGPVFSHTSQGISPRRCEKNERIQRQKNDGLNGILQGLQRLNLMIAFFCGRLQIGIFGDSPKIFDVGTIIVKLSIPTLVIKSGGVYRYTVVYPLKKKHHEI